MKVVVTGCWHHGKKLAGYDFRRERMAAMDDVVARASDADLVVHLGDLFDGGRPSPREYAEAIDMLEAVNRPTFIMKGNHDENPGAEPDALEPLLRYRFREEVKIVREPGVNGVNGAAFAFLPYWNDAKARAFRGKSAQEEADDLLRNVTRLEAYNSAGERVPISALFTHVDVGGIGYPVSETSQRVGVALPLEELVKLPFPVACGHLHRPSHAEPNVYFPGSLLPFDFSEDKPQRYVLELEL